MQTILNRWGVRAEIAEKIKRESGIWYFGLRILEQPSATYPQPKHFQAEKKHSEKSLSACNSLVAGVGFEPTTSGL